MGTSVLMNAAAPNGMAAFAIETVEFKDVARS
jgi:hypothetical protein